MIKEVNLFPESSLLQNSSILKEKNLSISKNQIEEYQKLPFKERRKICEDYIEKIRNLHFFKGKGIPFSEYPELLLNLFYIVHGFSFSFEEAVYRGYREPLKIICKKHGAFYIEYDRFLHQESGGCPECNKETSRSRKVLSQDQILEKCKSIHGEKYNYSKIFSENYINTRSLVPIICPSHGVFYQTLSNHLAGHGCPHCKSKRPPLLDKELFIKEAFQVHKNKYSYNKVDYLNRSVKVCITCPTHGDFWQTPGNHLRGHGCPKCSLNSKITQEDFIERSKKLHKEKYDYSKVQYVRYSEPLEIICPTHGSFWQAPREHLKGNGCPKCGTLQGVQKRRVSYQELNRILLYNSGDKCSVDLDSFNKGKRTFFARCKQHGLYLTNTDYIKQGYKCPICAESSHEARIRSFLEEKGVKFTQEKTFKDCKDKSLLPFDFYLPEYNTCIEYQGEHHFKPINFSKNQAKTQKSYILTKKHDLMKKEYCEENQINLLEIDFTESVEEKLEEYLKEFHIDKM